MFQTNQIKNLFFIPLETCLGEEGCHGVTERSAVPSSEARMYGVFSNEVRFKGVNLAPKGEGGAEGDE